jgi:hypothetical protein
MNIFLDDDINQSQPVVSQGIRSESLSLPFGIANVLQSSKIPQIPATTGINPWLITLHHFTQSSSTTALANALYCCATCSIQFRLTSELVHHIRIHHATRHNHHYHSLSTDPGARKSMKSSKLSTALTCDICHEKFRERHHLTRHMTSHR